ncbi:glycolate oxidase, iron-sulfur subunit [Gloeomargarita lithophora Alchichica-D10]|uniref:Glycolate oxidase iron-sulfur subunit n=1 Tax=Gloeomargarita lithophora Alchichica-D10 TaxID=1188229 RepID=A0A1J0ABU4_9CYAN|nr:heterodisulfide reductase-related iron-sulfur binding cluster [Gloeomargarita lithophora]APB33383.1 glycolate oxidase, iron-sulfur subunit [Gloeomargarita lithophora Alchichica-D10]
MATASGFDSQHPPSQAVIDTCVHCGFCLTTCPSYRVLGTEMDSPRGRIYQMNAINQGEIGLGMATVSHFDSCLGCLACVTACPSGVRYDELIGATRAQIQRNVSRSGWEMLVRGVIFQLFPYPERLRWVAPFLWLYQKMGWQRWLPGLLGRISPPLGAMAGALPPLKFSQLLPQPWPEVLPAQGTRRYRVGVILGCVQRLFNPQVNEATVRVLRAVGCEVVIPPQQGCCAALPQHQGETAQAQTLARWMIDSFRHYQLDAILINASGCGHTLKEYGHILADDPEYRERAQAFSRQVKDVQEFLAQIDLGVPLYPLADKPLSVVYQDACHMIHGQKISLQPRQLLRQIPGVELREPWDAALCCGSAGVYSFLQPETAQDLGRQKVMNLLNTGAQVIASANIGCTVQIQQYLRERTARVPVYHPVQLLDQAMRRLPLQNVRHPRQADLVRA